MPLEIFVPFWGDPELLRETVESVLSQTSDDWTLTVLDDAYPDASVAAYFATLDDARVRYVRNETNVGITANYERCVAMASQDVLMLLGCDDVLLPTFVETVLAAHATHPEAAIIQPGVQVIDERGSVRRTSADAMKQRLAPSGSEPTLLEGEELACSLLRGNWLYWPSLVFRTDVIQRTPFRPGLPIIQDLALVLDMVFAGESLLHVPAVCFSYRRHAASASAASVLDGSRFAGDRTYFSIAARSAMQHGWRRAARTARLRSTSRLHAVSLLPSALRRRPAAVGMLLHHALRP